MTFEEFHKNHPQYSYLVAKIHYNLELDKKTSQSSSMLADLVVQFSAPADGICESCTA